MIPTLVKYGLVLLIYVAFMLARYIYSGYVKAPKMIRYFQSIENKEKEAEWVLYMKKCRSDYVWIYSALLIFQLMALGSLWFAAFLEKAAS